MRNTCFWCGDDLRSGVFIPRVGGEEGEKDGPFHPACRNSYLESPTFSDRLLKDQERQADTEAWNRAEARIDRAIDRSFEPGDGNSDPDWGRPHERAADRGDSGGDFEHWGIR